MRTSGHTQLPSGTREAFTKLELLVVVALLVLLAGLRLAAATGLKHQTKVAQCAANLRQLGLSMLLYASDNADKLPAQLGLGSWLWDLDWYVGDILNQYGTPQEVMYCPGTAPRFTATNNEELYEYYAPGRVHVIGYAPTLPGSPSLSASNVNATVTAQPTKPFVLSPYTIPPPPASRRVLIADAIITHPGTPNYVLVQGAYKVPHLCPHVDGFVPAGGNVGMLDGHVEWRSFGQMQQRTTSAQTFYYW
jgi:prepilin-type processing-associated H-X9-DG protein